MKKNLFFIRLDIAEANFAASIYQTPGQPIVTKEAIPNDPKGFDLLFLWLKEHHIDKTNSHICMEATGVYSQANHAAKFIIKPAYLPNICFAAKVKGDSKEANSV